MTLVAERGLRPGEDLDGAGGDGLPPELSPELRQTVNNEIGGHLSGLFAEGHDPDQPRGDHRAVLVDEQTGQREPVLNRISQLRVNGTLATYRESVEFRNGLRVERAYSHDWEITDQLGHQLADEPLADLMEQVPRFRIEDAEAAA